MEKISVGFLKTSLLVKIQEKIKTYKKQQIKSVKAK